MGVAFTSYAIESQAQWPFVTLPEFNQRAANALSVAESLSLIYSPTVADATKQTWEEYTANHTERIGLDDEEQQDVKDRIFGISKEIELSGSGSGVNAPAWQHFPLSPAMINFDLVASELSSEALVELLSSQHVVMGKMLQVDSPPAGDAFAAYLEGLASSRGSGKQEALFSTIHYPLFDSFERNKNLVGILSMALLWNDFFAGLLPLGEKDEVVIVMNNACGQAYSFHVKDAFSFHVTNELATLLGEGDMHDVGYDHIEASFSFDSLDHTDSYFLDGTNAKIDRDFCLYSLHIYPTDQLQKQYVTFKPALYTASTAFVFLFIFIVSIAYERRVAQLIESGVEYRAIVANLFPAVVRERLFRSKGKERNLRDKQKNRRRRSSDIPKPILRTRTARFLREDEKKEAGDQIVDNDDWTQMSKPIADLFEHTTVLFADIAGFTSWSSGREPEHVFTLLQTLFNAFDRVARKRGVFKVETIGDCYMAVTGLPAVQEDHAIRMTKFARECLMRVSAILVRLQGTLGPDTGDLNMRFGLHSGPVTAGVLQGEKSRFQLFGDTVNTASRMESTGEVGRIHISKTTAGLLIEGGKGHWLEKRKEAVHAKGKGIVETYWVVGSTRTLNQGKQRRTSNESERLSDTEKMTASYSTMSAASTFDLNDSNWELLGTGNLTLQDLPHHSANGTTMDLIDWHVDLLGRYLKNIMYQQECMGISSTRVGNPGNVIARGSSVFDEVSETIPLPNLSSKGKGSKELLDPDSVALPQTVIMQLRDYVSTIHQSYLRNPFHSFARATHVSMFSHKLLQQITERGRNSAESDLTTAIASDPLLQFSLIFSALINDADHAGVSNEQLAKEVPDLARLYKGRLIAEQHSVDLAWELLMDPCYSDLQRCIFSTSSALMRFRQIVVNLVLATDLADKEMSGIRTLRWNEAFSSSVEVVSQGGKRRAKLAIVTELLVQLADVSHTMQAWHVYLQWNKNMFLEEYEAYRSGRSDLDPSKAWFARQVFLFDNHSIPLLEKLKHAKVLKCDELLKSARFNRQEWMLHGKQQTKKMVLGFHTKNKEDNSVVVLCHGSNNSSYRFSLEGEDELVTPDCGI